MTQSSSASFPACRGRHGYNRKLPVELILKLHCIKCSSKNVTYAYICYKSYIDDVC